MSKTHITGDAKTGSDGRTAIIADTQKKPGNMYPASVAQWNSFVGCAYDCVYCKSSFQRQQKRWGKKHCQKCYSFTPHEHRKRLGQPLPRTRFNQFIFANSSGDISFCRRKYLEEIADRMRHDAVKTFLLQSKSPQTFDRITFPDNVILGTTIETNRDDGWEKISKAPVPSQRYRDFLNVRHQVKMVTIEPVLDFDPDVLIDWITDINPCLIWLGYDSGKNGLPEPPLDKVRMLHWELSCRGFTVVLKTIRKAWWE